MRLFDRLRKREGAVRSLTPDSAKDRPADISKTRGAPARVFPILALTSLACGLLSLLWRRDFGGIACLDVFLAQMIEALIVLAGMLTLLVALLRHYELPRAVCITFLLLTFLFILLFLMNCDYVRAIRKYAVPPVSDGLGLLCCTAALTAGRFSLRRRERCAGVAAFGMALGVFVGITSFLYDSLTHSPYDTVRQFAEVSRWGDQQAMRSYFSRESLLHYDELRSVSDADDRDDDTAGQDDFMRERSVKSAFAGPLKTAGHMHGAAACETCLYYISVHGDHATADCPTPWDFEGRSFSRRYSGTINLVREEGVWKIDAWRTQQERNRDDFLLYRSPHWLPSQSGAQKPVQERPLADAKAKPVAQIPQKHN